MFVHEDAAAMAFTNWAELKKKGSEQKWGNRKTNYWKFTLQFDDS